MIVKGVFGEREFEGASQYRGPLCYELGGQSLHLIMDDGHEYLIVFEDGTRLSWSCDNGEFHEETYECMKSDELLYFINVELKDTPHRMGASLIYDAETNLVTLALLHQGNNPRTPDLITQEFIFGAVQVAGEELPKLRHGFTNDLVGKRIHWNYGYRMEMIHVYYNAHYIRSKFPEDPSRPRPKLTPEQIKRMKENPYDELCAYIRIRDGFYLVSFIEQNMTLRGGIGNNMMILVDAYRLHDIGRSFGLAKQKDGSIGTENYFFSAIGKWSDSDGEIENEPSVYRP